MAIDVGQYTDQRENETCFSFVRGCIIILKEPCISLLVNTSNAGVYNPC